VLDEPVVMVFVVVDVISTEVVAVVPVSIEEIVEMEAEVEEIVEMEAEVEEIVEVEAEVEEIVEVKAEVEETILVALVLESGRHSMAPDTRGVVLSLETIGGKYKRTNVVVQQEKACLLSMILLRRTLGKTRHDLCMRLEKLI
jgi:hypothetical protein